MNHVNQMIPKRTHSESGVSKVELRIFSDASLEAWCMVAYLRKQDKNEVSFVMQAAVFGVRLRELILEEHDIEIDRIVLWIGSKTVLQ